MRYRNWDILLFPGYSKVPIEEFQTSCSIVPDPDSTAHHGSGEVDNVTPALMPLMTTFIPSQPAGTPFRLSLHSWDPPPSAAQGQSFSTAPEIPKFEVLLRVDGKFVT
ncbi:MAG: hypothetical protein M1815_002678 [Lichina confinis]|nr:MAG: hypothetical protein M1815_002678 [Lichina confinis]